MDVELTCVKGSLAADVEGVEKIGVVAEDFVLAIIVGDGLVMTKIEEGETAFKEQWAWLGMKVGVVFGTIEEMLWSVCVSFEIRIVSDPFRCVDLI